MLQVTFIENSSKYENMRTLFLSIQPNKKYENMKTYFLSDPIEGAETNQTHFQALQRTNGKFWGKKELINFEIWFMFKHD